MATAGTAIDEITESISQCVAIYRTAFANERRGASYSERAGVSVACAGTLLPYCNGAVFTTPIENADDLERRVEFFESILSNRGLGGFLWLCDALVPDAVRDTVPVILERHGFAPSTGCTGMASEAILPPLHKLPQLRYEAVADRRTAERMAALNVLAYDMPPHWATDWEARVAIEESGWVGYLGYAGTELVTCAATLPLEGRLYVGLVATHAAYRGRGYAEAVMRHSLEVAASRTGLRRTVLHASDMGRRLYAEMGYHDTAHFTIYSRTLEHN